MYETVEVDGVEYGVHLDVRNYVDKLEQALEAIQQERKQHLNLLANARSVIVELMGRSDDLSMEDDTYETATVRAIDATIRRGDPR